MPQSRCVVNDHEQRPNPEGDLDRAANDAGVAGDLEPAMQAHEVMPYETDLDEQERPREGDDCGLLGHCHPSALAERRRVDDTEDICRDAISL